MDTTFAMKQIDPTMLVTTIFNSDANFLAPVELRPKTFGFDPCRFLSEEIDWQNSTNSIIASILGVEALCQYSLRRNQPVFAIIRCDGYMRQATPEEVQEDYRHFGEQVMGDEVTEENPLKEHETSLEFLGTHFRYAGPHRLENIRLIVRVCTGNIPDKHDISEILSEFEPLIIPPNEGEEKSEPRHFFLQATKGKLEFGGFTTIDEFNPKRLQHVGDVEMVDERAMFFCPEGDRSTQVDFSEAIFKG